MGSSYSSQYPRGEVFDRGIPLDMCVPDGKSVQTNMSEWFSIPWMFEGHKELVCLAVGTGVIVGGITTFILPERSVFTEKSFEQNIIRDKDGVVVRKDSSKTQFTPTLKALCAPPLIMGLAAYLLPLCPIVFVAEYLLNRK